MNILDFIYEFEANLEFTGDNECDYNELTIERLSGETWQCVKTTYKLSSNDLDEIELGLKALADKISKYRERELWNHISTREW